jgi:hypothetical protein
MALTGVLLEIFNIRDVKQSPGVVDDTGFPQRGGYCGYSAAPYTDHCAEVVLGDREVIANKISHAEKPPRDPRLCRMTRIAGRRLLDIRDPELFMGGKDLPDGRIAVQELTQRISVDHRSRAGHLHDDLVDRSFGVDTAYKNIRTDWAFCFFTVAPCPLIFSVRAGSASGPFNLATSGRT